MVAKRWRYFSVRILFVSWSQKILFQTWLVKLKVSLAKKSKARSLNDFSIAEKLTQTNENEFKPIIKTDQDQDYSDKFALLLQKLSKMYKEFPTYSIELLFDEFEIPISYFKILTNSFKIRGILIPAKNDYFRVNL